MVREHVRAHGVPGLTADADRIYRVGSAVLFSIVTLIVFLTFEDYGVTWDEPYHDLYGHHVLEYYVSGFQDGSALSYFNLWLYGGAFDGPVALAKVISPFGSYETAHLMNALVGLLGVFGACRIAAALGGHAAGFWAALLLLAVPSWYGHMFNNPKDIPFAAGMTWTLYYMIRAAPHFPRVPWALVVKLGLAIGLTLGVRIAGIFALIYLGAGLLAWWGLRLRAAGLATALREGVRAGFGLPLPALAIAWVVMIACWPWAQQEPLTRPFEALTIFANSPWNLDTLFEGRFVNSLDLPADYLPVYFAIKTPEILLLLLLAAVLVSLLAWRGRPLPAWDAFGGAFILGFAVLFPFVFFVAFRPVSYDVIRHFLFVFPPMAAVGGLVLAYLTAKLSDRPPWIKAAMPAALAAYFGWHGSVMAELHPHEYVYYNQLVGGVDGAENRFELDYWGNSYHEAVDRLVEHVRAEEATKGGRRGIYRVMVCSAGTSAAYFFPRNFILARNEREADFYISNTRLGCDQEYDGDTIVTVERDDAVLSVVKDRRRLRASAPDRLAARPSRGQVARQHPGLREDGAAFDPVAPVANR